jgi:hypothetical protein
MNKNNPSNPTSLSNNVIHVGTGDINLSNYIEPIGQTPCDDLDSNGHDDSYVPLPHQEPPDETTDTDSISSIQVDTEQVPEDSRLKTPLKKVIQPEATGAYQVPLSLRKQFRIPFKGKAPVVTPNSKATLSSTKTIQAGHTTKIVNAAGTNQTPTTSSKKTATNDADNLNQKPPAKPVLPILNEYENALNNTRDISENLGTEGLNAVMQRLLPKRELFDIYDSPYLNKMFKPTLESLNLTQELEQLTQLFLSQHEALTSPIKNLVTTNLTLTKMLEEKKKSSQLLHDHKKIPRSLRIKCELTTSPSYSSHPVFLKLKDELKQEVAAFITNGTKILAKWADTYIQLLTIDRCSDIMKQALQILDCLTTFYVGAIGTPLWPSVEDKHLTLFLFKAYLSDAFCETSVISNYFNLPEEDILLIGAKFLLKSDNDEETTKTLESLKLSDIDMEQYLDNFFLTEIFLNFDQILKISTLGAWHLHLEQSKQVMAAANMKSKLKSLQTINASAVTALAITKATENLNHQQSLDVKTNLRISNLERDLSKQGHKSNMIINLLKKSPQKNYQGSYSTEPVTSPETQALTKQRQNQKLSKKLKRNFIDLTTEEAKEELNLEKTHPTSIQSTKRAKKIQRKSLGPTKNQQTSKKKSIQWKDTKTIQQFHPQYPVTSSFIQHTPANTFTMQNDNTKPPLFPPPPPPHFPFHPTYAQNSPQPQYGLQNGMPPLILPHQQISLNPFLKQPQSSNPFTNTGHNPSLPFGKNPFQTYQNPFHKTN